MTITPRNDTVIYTDHTGDQSAAPMVVARPPSNMISGDRLRVDTGNSGFFQGREFRTFLEFTASQVIQVVVPVNSILYQLGVTLTQGEVRVETVAGGTPGGTFGTPLPIIPHNSMTERPTPIYNPQVTLAAGGTHTGGTILDVLHVKADSNSNRAFTVGDNNGDERGIAPATYYFRITVTGTTDAILRLWWEERP